MALTAAVGRLIVPILVQLVLDNGVLSDDGYDGAYVWTVSMAALPSCCSSLLRAEWL